MAGLGMGQKEQNELGLPPGFKLYSPFPFGTLNQVDSRIGMGDNELYWIENFIKDGNGQLRTLYDVGTPIYVAPPGKTIVSFFFYNIGTTQYAIVFLNDGTAVQVNVDTLAQTVVSSTANTFYTATNGTFPACVQSGNQYLLIANNNTANDYWLWDGSVLYATGGISPVVTLLSGGSGYTSVPTVTAFGGAGSGITATATINGGSVTGLTITNPGTGYSPSDVVQFRFSGGGSDTGAQLTAVLASAAVGSLVLVSAGTIGSGTPGTYNLVFAGGGGGVGAAGTAVVGADGTITSIQLTAGGSGYTATPTVAIDVASGVLNSSILVTLTAGAVSTVTVTQGGTNFTGTPILTFIGGGGTGATAVANMSAGAINSVTVTNGGTGYTSTPAIIVSSGQNHAAAALASMMPSGISGTTIETFSGRVIVGAPTQTGAVPSGGIFNLSAPQSLVNFSTSSGGLTFTSNDRFLRSRYVVMRQSNGYLYPFGDSSVSVMSNIQTAGNPLTTTFNYQNVDPQVGIAWRDSCQDFGRTSLFANALGVFGLYGGAVTKVSSKIDHLFASAVFPAAGGVTPSAAVANIRAIKVYMILLTITDPFTGTPRKVMAAWDQTNWFIASQGVDLAYIGTQEVNSNLQAWGTDGAKLYPLLNRPSATLRKVISSKLYGAQDLMITKQALMYYVQAIDRSGSGIQMSVSVDTENGSFPASNNPVLPGAPPPDGWSRQVYGATAPDAVGQELGFTITSTSPDFELLHAALGYKNVTSING